MSDKLPDTKIALLKVCSGSTYLGNYSSKPNDCWVPPSSNNGTAGPHYKRMLSAITASFNSFNSAFDTKRFPTDGVHYKAQGQVRIGTTPDSEPALRNKHE